MTSREEGDFKSSCSPEERKSSELSQGTPSILTEEQGFFQVAGRGLKGNLLQGTGVGSQSDSIARLVNAFVGHVVGE